MRLRCSAGGSWLYTSTDRSCIDAARRCNARRSLREGEYMKVARSKAASATQRAATALLFAGAMASLSILGAPIRAQTIPDYRLHPGDKLVVGVYDDPKLLPQEITVRPDGKISYPLLGELLVAGKSVE